MTKRTSSACQFHRLRGRQVEASFDGGNVTSDGGLLLVREAEGRLGLLRRVARLIRDPRRKASCDHSFSQILKQRVFGIALGYEDLNDHGELRDDLAWRAAISREERLASPSAISRLEARATREWTWAAHQALFEHFVQSFDEPPDELILDFDTTDDQVHGTQEGRFFHGYYDGYCFLPLYVFCGRHLLVAMLQKSSGDGAKHAGGVLALLVRALRRQWPGVRIVFRADSGFSRWRLHRWCERNGVHYVTGIQKNKRLIAAVQDDLDEAARRFDEQQVRQRWFRDLSYAAGTWDRERRIIAKIEHLSGGTNPRFLVTNLEGSPDEIYDRIYCARGEMENRIKEQQLDLFADRTSCHRWWPNQWRLTLASLAYALLNAIRDAALRGTPLANATCGTIRLRLLKIGALITQNTRRVRFRLNSHYPLKQLFQQVAARLQAT